MIRTYLAALLLKTFGATVEYRVQRTRFDSKKRGDGTTSLRTDSYKDARRKYKTMRVADTDQITIRLVATVAQRHGTVEAKKETQ